MVVLKIRDLTKTTVLLKLICNINPIQITDCGNEIRKYSIIKTLCI